MGFELANFVEGQSVSRHLICSICHGVLENPVQTACEHLFCEDELIEWLCHKSSCPVCQAEIDPEDIVRAPRAIVGLINDLERYCDHAKYGCPWTGTSDAVVKHCTRCTFAPREALVEALEAANGALDEAKRSMADQDREIARLCRRTRELEASLAESKDDRDHRDDEMDHLRRRVRFLERALEGGDCYGPHNDALDNRWASSGGPGSHGAAPSAASPARARRHGQPQSDVGRINSLRESLETLRVHPARDSAQ